MIDGILSRSRATDAFKADVLALCAGGSVERVDVRGYIPRVKVERILTQLLAAEPHLDAERVTITGRSGCSDVAGTVEVRTSSGPRTYDFVWDCRWRAEQEGWFDCFGFPDQMRAAQAFDWQCFSVWSERPSPLAGDLLSSAVSFA